MQIKIQCPICKRGINQKQHLGDKTILGGICYTIIPNTDNNIIQNNCGKHNYIVFLDNKKFDLLFESGIWAIKDLYFREAVASLASSLERFYEYCIQGLAIEHFNRPMFDATWKLVSKQSERQIGAFIFLYLKQFNLEPPILSSKDVEFRNKVIHKGYFPNEVETLNYLNSTAKIITEIYSKLTIFKKENIELLNKECVAQIESNAQSKILKIKQHPGYDPRSKSRIVNQPIRKTLPTFLAKIDNKIPTIEDLNRYINSPIETSLV